MRILVVGGGPGGLFFSILSQRQNPHHQIRVVEQNPRGATYGWGVVFTDRAIAALRPSAPDVIDDLVADQTWPDHMEVVLNGDVVRLEGFGFCRIGRVALLDLLQKHAEDAGVEISHEHRVEHLPADGEFDLVIGADGVNSSVRSALNDQVEPTIRLGRNWWAWFGTNREFGAISLIFVQTTNGLYIGHAYAYAPGRSGFVVEVTPEVFLRDGLGELDEESSRRHCADVFADYLGGHELLGNRSVWFQPRFVTCSNWSYRNVTLLGDALHTVHPSIGSGTRFAMRDAVALADAVHSFPDDAEAAIRRYEEVRRPIADGFQRTAMRSIAWYEGLAGRDLEDAEMFGIEFAMRTGSVRWREFRRRNPTLVSRFENPVRPAVSAGAVAGGASRPALDDLARTATTAHSRPG